MSSILITAAEKLDAFNIAKVKNLTSEDTMNLNTFGGEQDLIFIPDAADYRRQALYVPCVILLYADIQRMLLQGQLRDGWKPLDQDEIWRTCKVV